MSKFFVFIYKIDVDLLSVNRNNNYCVALFKKDVEILKSDEPNNSNCK